MMMIMTMMMTMMMMMTMVMMLLIYALKVVGAQHGSVLNLDPLCCVLHQFGPVLLRSALIWSRVAPFCSGLMLIL